MSTDRQDRDPQASLRAEAKALAADVNDQAEMRSVLAEMGGRRPPSLGLDTEGSTTDG